MVRANGTFQYPRMGGPGRRGASGGGGRRKRRRKRKRGRGGGQQREKREAEGAKEEIQLEQGW